MAKKTKYDSEFCEKLIEHCRAGHDISSFGATIGCSRATIYKWIDLYPDFKLAHEAGISFLKMRATQRLIDFAEGRMERNASVVAAIYLAKVYGVRDDIHTDNDNDNENKDKMTISLQYKLEKPKQLDNNTIEAEVIKKE